MSHIRVALALLLAVFLTLALPATAYAVAIDQARWNESKTFIQLPNGLRMAYVEAGNPKGEPLLLLHGYTDSSRSFSLMVPHLSRYRLLIPDQRGHGASDAPECCYGTSQFAYDAGLLLDALGVKRAAVAGHSLGSMVAMSFASDHPDRVSEIILIGSTALVPVKRGDWLYDNATAVKGKLDPSTQFAKDWHPANQPTKVDPAFAAAVNDELLRIPAHVWHGVLRELSYVPAGRHAVDVRVPVLIISGGKDPIFSAEHHRSLLTAFPGAKAEVFADLGHNPNWEQPEAVASAIDRFIKSNR